jgi:hypothetical protein
MKMQKLEESKEEGFRNPELDMDDEAITRES